MDLYKEILIYLWKNEEIEIRFPNLNISAERLIEIESYVALYKIKTIIEDTSLNDKECFLKIEKIIQTLEEIGSNGGNRHDFG